MVTEQQSDARRAHPEPTSAPRSSRVGHRLRRAQPDLDLALHRRRASGSGLSRPARPAGRRRRARPLPRRRPGPQHRRAGCGEPGLEARAGRARELTGEPPRHLSRRTPSGRRPRTARHGRADLAAPRRRPHRDPGRHDHRVARDGRAAPALRRTHVRPGRPLRPRRGPSAARAPHAGSRPRYRRGPGAGLQAAARGPRGVFSTWARPALSTSRLGGSCSVRRRRVRRRLGTPGPRRGQRSDNGPHPAGRLRGLGRRRHARGPRRGAHTWFGPPS